MISLTDTLIGAAGLALVVGLYALLWRPGAEATEVSVWVSGRETLRLPLDQDRRVDVAGAIGVSVVEVRQRQVRVAASPGPRQICVRTGWLTQAGESAICLPNQVVVQVEGPHRRFDAMNF